MTHLSFNYLKTIALFIVGMLMIQSCEKYELPEAGSVPDASPPKADFSFTAGNDINSLTVDFANFSTHATIYSWDFGDGTTSTDKNPSKTYAATGEYTVTLTASDKLDAQSTFSATVSVVKKPIARFSSQASDTNSLTIIFTNLSTNTKTYAWDFGNGETSTDTNPTLTYVAEGNYTVRLAVLDELGESDTSVLNIKVEDFTVKANFSASVSDTNSLTVAFTNFSRNAKKYAWDFGDGTTSTDEVPSKTYATAGDYTIKLLASDESGDQKDSLSVDITVVKAPVANFSYTPSDPDFLTINFKNLSTNATSYSWNLGNGQNSTQDNPTVTYPAEAEYDVTLTASDGSMEHDTTITITVEDPNFQPVIVNPAFDIEDPDAYRNGWRNSDLGGPIQITSTKHQGVKAAKFPSGGDRIAYQEITVRKNKNYTISFFYRLKSSPVGSMTVAILAGSVDDPADVAGATIKSVELKDQSDTYVASSISFDSGDNTTVAIYITNVGVEAKADTFTIVEN